MADAVARWNEGSGGALATRSEALLPTRSRGEIFAALTVLGLTNGLLLPIYDSITDHGWWAAILATFGVSTFVWIAILAIPMLMLRSATGVMTTPDKRVACVALVLIAAPLPHLSWVGLTGLALYLIYGPTVTPAAPSDSFLRRGAVVLLASTISVFWGRLVLENGGSVILAADAAVVSCLTGMAHVGNVIETTDGGHIWIAPYCSSLSNISLAVLCSALVIQWRNLAWTGIQALRCLTAAVMVMVINDVRIAAMVLRPDLYETIHGTTGAAVANILTVGVIACTILWGNERREHLAR